MHLCTALLLTGALVEYCESPAAAAAALFGVALLHAGAAQQASLRAKANGSAADLEAITVLARQRLVSFVLIQYPTTRQKAIPGRRCFVKLRGLKTSGRRRDAPSLKA
ncbi:hypothetical protein HL42_8061 [Trichophyton rubrum]|nr:hypothetical protein HL42_8061 [Trichophyton rubrum]